MSVACVEKRDTPRRHLPQYRLHPVEGAAAIVREIRRGAARAGRARRQGRRASSSTSPTMMARKDKVVAENTSGVAFLFRKNKVDAREGRGAASSRANRARRSTARALEAKRAIIIATGSDSVPLPGVAIDEKTDRLLDRRACRSPRCRSVSSWSAAAISGSSWARCGAGSAREVTVVEFLDRITPGMDGEIEHRAAAHAHEAGLRLPARHQGGRGEARQRRRHAGARAGRRAARARTLDGRRGAGVDRAAALHRRARARDGGRRARQSAAASRVDAQLRHQRPRHLRHRRRDRRADAGAQGGGRRRRRSPRCIAGQHGRSSITTPFPP